jgi:hypothetical protein
MVLGLRCPLCGKDMTPMKERGIVDSPPSLTKRQEVLYFCGQHGVMNKSTDLKEKTDQIAKRA